MTIPRVANIGSFTIGTYMVEESLYFLLGNVVAACHSCNDQRGKKPWRTWLQDKLKNDSPKKIAKIDEYLAHYPYSPPAGPSDRLIEPELIEYSAIMNDWQKLWLHALKPS